MTRRSSVMRAILYLGVCLFCLDLSAVVNHTAHSQRIDLSGKWEFQTAELKPLAADVYRVKSKSSYNQDWQLINVPSNWYLEGKDIYGKAWYRKSFNLNKHVIGKHVSLNFQGVDYIADVWLNGRYLGHHEGYFQPFEFDITKIISKGENTLLVLVDSPIEDPTYAWSLRKRLIKGIFSHHDTRPGGAWSPRGQEKNTGGIWAPVYLDISNRLALKSIEAVPAKRPNDWVVKSILNIDSDLPDDAKVTVETIIEPQNFSGKKLKFVNFRRIRHGESTLVFNHTVHNPKLWWPNGYGAQNLYTIRVLFKYGKKILHQKKEVFGFRDIDVGTSTQEWKINGRRLFIRGTNYISSQWLTEMSPDRYARDISLMQDANINAIRVHAHIESSAFYALCDQKGMLVFQDFPLQWGYSDDAMFTKEARRQVKEMVHVLNNHPSIVEWALHNEPPWDASWMTYKYPDYNPKQNYLLDELLYKDVSGIESSRYVRKHSATSEHAWMGWYFGSWKDFSKPTKNPWISEYGAQALPEYTSLLKIFTQEELWPDNDKKWEKWSYHNFQRHETFELAKIKQGKDISEFIYNTQQYQANLIKLAAESYRRQRYAPVTGIFQFMFVEDWPSINWGIVDYWRNPKRGYHALKSAYQPVLPNAELIADSYQVGDVAEFRLWIINDLWQSYPDAEFNFTVSIDNQVLEKKLYKINVADDSAEKVDQFSIKLLQEGTYKAQLKVHSSSGLLLGENEYLFDVKK